MVPILDHCDPWQAGGCEWSIQYLWQWMSWLAHADVVLLALILAFIVVRAIRIFYLCHVDRKGVVDSSSQSRRRLAADLSIQRGFFKSIATTAPYLGLLGTCEGVLSAFTVGGMQKDVFRVMIATRLSAALITTAAGILVATPATVLYHYLRTQVDLLESEVFVEACEHREQASRVASRLPLRKGFSTIPSFAIIAAPLLATLVTVPTIFPSFYPSMGLVVGLVKVEAVRSEDHLAVDRIVVRLVGASDEGRPTVCVNSKKMSWNELDDALRSEPGIHAQAVAYVEAESNVRWADVATVMGLLRRLQTNVVLLTIMPNTNACRKPVVRSRIRGSLRYGY